MAQGHRIYEAKGYMGGYRIQMVRLELGPIASWDASCMRYRAGCHETALVLRGMQTCEATHAPGVASY